MINRQITELLKEAVETLNRDRPDQAEALLSRILQEQPAMPQALMLMGMVRLLQNRNAEAESLLLQALQQSPGQPSVLFHLGSALRAQGKFDSAIGAYRQAIKANPQHVETQLALGAVLREKGDLAKAEKTYRALLQSQPQSLAAIAGLGAVLNGLERAAEAEALLSAVSAGIAGNAINPELENSLGEAKMMQRRPAEALVHFSQALATAPQFLAAEKNRATALELLQDSEAAATAYRRVLAQDPLDLKTHILLNELLHRSGDADNFLRSYDEAAKARPDTPLLANAKADQLLKIGRAAEAHDAFQAALALAPQDVAARIGLARSLTALGENAQAIAAYETGLRQHPDNADLKTAFAYCLLANADAHKAQTLAEGAVAQEPHSQPALAVLGLCYRANDDGRGESLNGFENFVSVFDLEPPDGYADMVAFSHELENHVDALHLGSREFFSQTLRGGTRSFEDFFAYRHALRAKLRQRVDQALAHYIATLKGAQTHPFVGRRGKSFGFSGSWSSRMQAGGFHLNHIHSGWISSVYYIAVPDIAADATAKEGWLKFGEPSTDIGLKDAIRRTVQPRPGRLVLFPSYMWHGTVPYTAPGTRTTIAFDVIPR